MKNYLVFFCLVVSLGWIGTGCNAVKDNHDFTKRKHRPWFKMERTFAVTKIDQHGIWQAKKSSQVDGLIASAVLVAPEWKPVFPDSVKCDEIILRNGSRIKAVVLAVGEDRIRYKKCENQSGPEYGHRKEEVYAIQYADGRKVEITTDDYFSDESGKPSSKQDSITKPVTPADISEKPMYIEKPVSSAVTAKKLDKAKKVNPFALSGFWGAMGAFTIAWLSIAIGFVLAIPALVFSIIALIQCIKDREKHKHVSLKLSILGLIVAFITILLCILAFIFIMMLAGI